MRTIKIVFAIAALALSSAGFSAETAQRIQISTQPLATALMEFSKQTDIVVVAPAELVQGKVAPRV